MANGGPIINPEALDLGRPDLLREKLLTQELEVLCPCHAVAQYLISQEDCYRILSDTVKTEAYRCVRFRDLWELSQGERAKISAIDPTDTTDEVIFVRPGLLEDSAALIAHPDLREVFEAAGVPRYFMPTYAVGPPLSCQPGSIVFQRQLRSSFQFLNALGLLSSAIVAQHFAHTSVLMLMRRCLGLPNYGSLISYIENPPGFIAAALANAVEADDTERGDLFAVIHDLYGSAADSRPLNTRSEQGVALTAAAAALILSTLEKSHFAQALRLRHLPERLPAPDAELLKGGPIPIDAEHFAILHQVVVVVDLARYSDIARELEEHLDPKAVADLNRQIAGFTTSALEKLGLQIDRVPHKWTGDGAILAFDHAVQASSFAAILHRLAASHNTGKKVLLAQRHFRIGIYSDDIVVQRLKSASGEFAGFELAGTAVSNAVRLEGACRTGEVLIDADAWEALTPELRPEYGDEETVPGKRTETFRVRRRKVTEAAPWN